MFSAHEIAARSEAHQDQVVPGADRGLHRAFADGLRARGTRDLNRAAFDIDGAVDPWDTPGLAGGGEDHNQQNKDGELASVG